jgi:hypothetical protein
MLQAYQVRHFDRREKPPEVLRCCFINALMGLTAIAQEIAYCASFARCAHFITFRSKSHALIRLVENID